MTLSRSLGFIVFFILMTLVVTMVFGSKVGTWFLALVLLSMVVVNADKMEVVINKAANLGGAAPAQPEKKGNITTNPNSPLSPYNWGDLDGNGGMRA